MSGTAQSEELARLRAEVVELRRELEQLRQERASGEDGIYRAFVEQIYDIPYRATPLGELVYIGHQVARYGLDPAQVIAEGVMSVIAPEDRERVGRDIERTLTTGEEFATDFRLCAPDGRPVWLEDHGKLIRDAAGEPVALIGFLRDVTAQREAREALRISEERFRTVAEQSIDAIFEVDGQGKVAYVSPSSSQITGVSVAEVLAEPYNQRVVEQDRGKVAEVFAQLMQGEPVRGLQLRLESVERGVVTLEINATPVTKASGERSVVGIARDITARVALEAQVREMQKMEALGTLARGVAHDFNNQLLGILGFASLLQELGEPGDQVHEAGEVIQQAAERASDLIRQLQGFAARGPELESTPQDMHALIGEVAALLGRTLDKRIEILRWLEATEYVVLGDAGQLHQVLLNLGVNAGQAMDGAGSIIFESATVQVAPGQGNAPADLASGSYLRLAVHDTGCGIAEEHLGRVFEPFFTTKPQGEGSGMGLAMAYGIVRAHQGAIRARSEAGNGSTVEVWLPLAAGLGVGARVEQSTPQPGRLTGVGTVLVVDDEKVVRRTLRSMLGSLGYQVLEARDGKQGLSCYEAHRDEIDLVLLDLSMPVMDGRECYHALRQLDPGVKVLIASGDLMDSKLRELSGGSLPAIAKPYTRDVLGEAIGRVLRSGEAG